MTSAASFPDGGAARPPTSASSAVDDLLGLENEISAIQVKKSFWVKERISVNQSNMAVEILLNFFVCKFISVLFLFEHLLGRYPSDRSDHPECTTELPDRQHDAVHTHLRPQPGNMSPV